jgi:hypothetical protein
MMGGKKRNMSNEKQSKVFKQKTSELRARSDMMRENSLQLRKREENS